MWLTNGIISGLALLVLLIGIIALPALMGQSSMIEDKSGVNEVDKNAKVSGEGDAKKDSSLMLVAKQLSDKWNPVKKVPKPKKPKVVAKKEVKKEVEVKKPPPPPPPPPKPKPKPKPKKPPAPPVPPPTFTVDATMIVGDKQFLAWVKTLKAKSPRLFALGEEINGYEIVQVSPGEVKVKKNGKDFTLKVTKKKAKSTAVSQNKNKKQTNVKRPTRRSRTNRANQKR